MGSCSAPAPAARGGTCRRGRYRERNTVERCFSKLKQFRAVATRYDEREHIYRGTVDVASIRIWLRDPVT
jgi:transposase